MAKRKGKITSTELARICGVSQGTVDRALNDRSGISPKTKERILKAAEEYGYIKNMHASGLVRGRSMLLGLVVFDLKNEFFSQLATAVEMQAKAEGYSLLIMLTHRDKEEEMACIRRLCGMGADGIVLCPVGCGEAYEEWLLALQKPIVTVGNRLSEQFYHVGMNDRQAMQDMVAHVLARGYRRLVYVYTTRRQAGINNIYAQQERYEGFAHVLVEQSDAESTVDATSTVIDDERYPEIISAMDFSGPNKTAIICPSDYQALKIMAALEGRGVGVPAQVGVAGFDNLDMLQYVRPRLVTVGYPASEAGRLCVEALVTERPETAGAEIGYRIIAGESL